MHTQVESIRTAARRHQSRLPSAQRKRLGQHFSGLQVGRLLTHLALDKHIRTVLDPMAGTGDLLDATWEAAAECGVALDCIDGVEIDGPTAAVCRDRMRGLLAGVHNAPKSEVIVANAFDAAAEERLAHSQYDLVITNPPYVRYQGRADQGTCAGSIRRQLHRVLVKRQTGPDAPVWRAAADGFSGLADLSIPAWLLAAALVRSGGRLALVVPATWRSRDYADVVRLLMSHCFEVERVVEGPRSAWFADALVCTHLVVARRRWPAGAKRGSPTREPPLTMPVDLSGHVRFAARTAAAGAGVGKPIPELSAVRTNRRPCRPGKAKPRFWYMLPDFAPRHLPAVAIPRVNHDALWAEANCRRRLLMDANFATVWARRSVWTPHALKALLNSAWCRAVMEALCTPMGGGALKVEATHLRRLPLPRLSERQRATLTKAGRRLTRDTSATQVDVDDIVLGALGADRRQLPKLAKALRERTIDLVHARRA